MGAETTNHREVAQEAEAEAGPQEAVPTRPSPTGVPVIRTCPHQGRVDCTGNLERLLGHVLTDIIVLGGIMNPQDQDTTEIYLLQK